MGSLEIIAGARMNPNEHEQRVGAEAAEAFLRGAGIEPEEAYATDMKLAEGIELTAEEMKLSAAWHEAENAAMSAINRQCGWAGTDGHKAGDFYILTMRS